MPVRLGDALPALRAIASRVGLSDVLCLLLPCDVRGRVGGEAACGEYSLCGRGEPDEWWMSGVQSALGAWACREDGHARMRHDERWGLVIRKCSRYTLYMRNDIYFFTCDSAYPIGFAIFRSTARHPGSVHGSYIVHV